jgi:His-Xaa-Ser system protein HxsD
MGSSEISDVPIEITVIADSSIFSKEAVLKCLYWYGDKYHTDVALTPDGSYSIKIRAATKVSDEEFSLLRQKLERDLVDFQLRDTISKETHNIRELLVAKAFSNGEFDQEPPGDVSDPVGYDPNS